jgi:hypothetical protein
MRIRKAIPIPPSQRFQRPSILLQPICSWSAASATAANPLAAVAQPIPRSSRPLGCAHFSFASFNQQHALMSNWNNNNAAHVNMWAVLGLLTQHNVKFKPAGPLKMSDLKFWINTASAEMRTIMAGTIAAQIDRFFCDKKNGLSAKYEPEVTQAQAIAALQTALSNGTKTIEDLANIGDENYAFIAIE